MNATGYLIIALLLLVLRELLDLIVDALNLRHASERVPSEFEGWMEPEKYARSRRYQSDNVRFNRMQSLVTTPLTILFILFGGFGLVDRLARSAGGGMITTGLLFAGILILLGMLISLPFDLYDTFVIEARYDFNRTTPKTFILDRIKGIILTVLIGAPAISLVLWFFSSLPKTGWLFAWGALALLQLMLSWLAPSLILPLFNTFTPLGEGELRDKIEAFAGKHDLTLKGIYSIDGSRRSSKANAFFTGLGKAKRIALFDTLIEKHPVRELIGVLAHEVGHDRKHHLLKGLAVSLVNSAFTLFLLQFFLHTKPLYDAFGVSFDSINGQSPIYGGIFFFGLLYAPVSMLTGIAGKSLSRRWEYEADAYASRTTGAPDALADALKRLSVDSLSDLTPHPFKVFLEYSHPPVLARVKALLASDCSRSDVESG